MVLQGGITYDPVPGDPTGGGDAPSNPLQGIIIGGGGAPIDLSPYLTDGGQEGETPINTSPVQQQANSQVTILPPSVGPGVSSPGLTPLTTPQQAAMSETPLDLNGQAGATPLQGRAAVNVGGQQLPAYSVLAQLTPQQQAAAGFKPSQYIAQESDAAGGADPEAQQGQESLDGGEQQQQEVPYEPLSQDDLSPAFPSSFGQQQQQPIAMLPNSMPQVAPPINGALGAAPSGAVQAANWNYPLAQSQQLPPSPWNQPGQKAPRTDYTPTSPELEAELSRLRRAQEVYRQIISRPSPLEQVQDRWKNRGPGIGQRLMHAAAAMGGAMSGNAPNRNVEPMSLNQELASPAFRNQQQQFDFASQKYQEVTDKIADIEKSKAEKRAEIEDRVRARENVPAATRFSVVQALTQLPTYQPGPNGKPVIVSRDTPGAVPLMDQNRPIKSADGSPVFTLLDPNKMHVIDMFIASNLLDPKMRNAAMFTHTAGSDLALQSKALDVAHKAVNNKILEETNKLRFQKLQKSVDIDMALKNQLLKNRTLETQLGQLRGQQIGQEMSIALERQLRDGREEERKIRNDQTAMKQHLETELRSWFNTAKLQLGTPPNGRPVEEGSNPFTGVSNKAILQAQKNVKMIQFALNGRLENLSQAYGEIMGKPFDMDLDALQKLPHEKWKEIADRAYAIEQRNQKFTGQRQ